MNVEQWLNKAREMRAKMYENEVAFYMHLVSGETAGVHDGVAPSFVELLRTEDVCDIARYVSFRDAIGNVGATHASAIGVDGVIRAGAVKDPGRRDKIIVSLEEARRRRRVPLSAREIGRIVQQIAPVERDTRDLVRAMSRDKTEAELRALRRENERLRKENARLRARLAKKEGAGKARGKAA